MHTWEFEALDAKGARVKGRIRAPSKDDALELVTEKQLHPLFVKQRRVDSGLLNHISSEQLEQLVLELSLLLRNGVQLDRALDMMSDSNANAVASAMLSEVTEAVRGGRTLSDTLANYPRYFDTLFCQMVKIGEESGKLAETLERLGHNQKFQNDLKSKITQALIYPAFILFVCVSAIIGIFNFIIPSMSGLFDNMKDIPPYTQFLLDSSEWFRDNQRVLLVLVLALVFFVFISLNKPWFKRALNDFLRKIPILRSGLLLSERIRYVSAMQLMLQSGLPLAHALEFSINIVTTERLKRQLSRVRELVSQGTMLSEALAATDIVEPMMLSLVQVGEESGNLDSIFVEITNRSRHKFEQWTMKLTSMLEPALIIIMGVLVGSVVVTMLLSIVATSDVPF